MKKLFFLMAWLCLFSATAQDQFGGLALYTLREEMGKNPNETLKTVSDIGYAYVEAAGYNDGKFYGMSPQEFKDLIGQEVMAQTITNAIKLGKTPNAYLLTGIRGVGKTTTARLIAKALNCEKNHNQKIKSITRNTTFNCSPVQRPAC